MTPKHLATTMAALNIAATPPHLRAGQGLTMSAGPATTQAAGGATQAAPRAAEPGFSWDDVVAEHNASIPGATKAHQGPASTGQDAVVASEQEDAGFSWDDVVAEHNASNGFTQGAAR